MPDDNDPWKRHSKKNESEPPNLDEVFNKLIAKFSQIEKLHRQKNKSGGDGGDQNPATGSLFGFGLIASIIFFIWLLSGIFIISPPEQGVILRFGKYQETVGPGPHWIPRFIKSVKVVNVERISNFSYEADMLTKDENIVFVSLSVQFRVDNPHQFLFNIVNPVSSLQQATASTLRQVIGNTSLDEVLTTGRARIRDEVEKQLKSILMPYQAGLLITDVNIQPARPPKEVTDAFDDAIMAREDKERYINGARAYAEKVVLLAQGRASRLVREAQAFQEQVILKAKADTAVYLALLPEYKHAPNVTKQRLYLETIESVFDHSNKVLVDVGSGHNLIYLPIDKILSQSNTHNASSKDTVATMPTISTGIDQPSASEPEAKTINHNSSTNRPTLNTPLRKRLKYSETLSE